MGIALDRTSLLKRLFIIGRTVDALIVIGDGRRRRLLTGSRRQRRYFLLDSSAIGQASL